MNIFDEGATDVLAQALGILVETEKLLVVNNNQDPGKEDVGQCAFALCGEVHELADELGWKSWKLPRDADHERSKDEFADVLAFLGVMAQLTNTLAGTNCWSLAEQFRAKTRVNIERINEGKHEGYGGPLAQRVVPRSQLVVGQYYEVEYHGQRAVAHLEGIGAYGLHCFRLKEVDAHGLEVWWLTGDDQGWIARLLNG
jgi:NTP pyrophosphatase (non-canonical NTP hydrolase)